MVRNELIKQAMNKSGIRGIVFFMVLVFNFCQLSAQTEVQDSIYAERLKEIQNTFTQDRSNALHWWYGWIWGYNAATLGQGIVYFATDNRVTKQDMILGSATTLLGTLGLILTPIVPKDSNLQNIRITEGGPEEQFLSMEYYEESLKEIARREKLGRSWKTHAVCTAVNMGSGLITWKGFNRSFQDGLVNFALNTVITEAQIWTQPIRALKDYQNYSRKYSLETNQAEKKSQMEWYVYAYPGRISFRLDF